MEVRIGPAHGPGPERDAACAVNAAGIDDGELRLVLPFLRRQGTQARHERLAAGAADLAQHAPLAVVLDVPQRPTHLDRGPTAGGTERGEPRLPASD